MNAVGLYILGHMKLGADHENRYDEVIMRAQDTQACVPRKVDEPPDTIYLLEMGDEGFCWCYCPDPDYNERDVYEYKKVKKVTHD